MTETANETDPNPKKRDNMNKTRERDLRRLGEDIYEARAALGPDRVTEAGKAARAARADALDLAAAFNALALGAVCPEDA